MYLRLIHIICNGSTLIHSLLILVIGLTLYANTFKAPFLFDDFPCFVNNRAVIHYFDNSMSFAEKRSNMIPDAANSMDARPFVYFTFALNYLVHGFNVTGYHIVNLLIHLAAAFAVYVLLSTLLNTAFFHRHHITSTLRKVVPFVIALLFVSHPIQTSAVTYITQRFTSLATLIYLLSIIFYLKARMSDGTKRQIAFLASSVGLAAVGMFTKEIVFTVPVIAVVCEILFLSGGLRKRIFFLLPLLGTMLIIPFNMFSQIDATRGMKEILDDSVNLLNLDNVSQISYLLTQFRVIVTYLRLLLFPVNQHLDYDYPRFHSLFEVPVAMSALLLFSIIISAVWAYRKSQIPTAASVPLRLYCLGVAWFFVTISMSSSIFPLSDMIFEFRMYLPSTGFFTAITAITVFAIQKLRLPEKQLAKLVSRAIFMIVLSFSVATVSRNHVWGDAIRFWEDNVAKAPNKKRPREQLLMQYERAGKLKEHIEQGEILIAMAPDDPEHFKLLNDMAVNLVKLKRFDEALDAIERAIALNPEDKRLQGTYHWVLSFSWKKAAIPLQKP